MNQAPTRIKIVGLMNQTPTKIPTKCGLDKSSPYKNMK